MSQPHKMKAVSSARRTDHVREQLLLAIEHGDYKPGDALPSERTLSESLGVSRVSVREAILSLQAIGLVNVQQGRGTFVLDRSSGEHAGPYGRWLDMYRREALDLLDVRGAIDQMVAQRAAERADPEALARVKEAHEEFCAAVEDPTTPIQRLTQLDIAFHRSIGEASGNELASHLLHDLNSYLVESRRISLSPRDRVTASAAEHGAIVAALTSDPAKARRAAREHVEHVRALLEKLEKLEAGAEGDEA